VNALESEWVTLYRVVSATLYFFILYKGAIKDGEPLSGHES